MCKLFDQAIHCSVPLRQKLDIRFFACLNFLLCGKLVSKGSLLYTGEGIGKCAIEFASTRDSVLLGLFGLSNLGLSRLVLAYLLSHNTIHSASRTLFIRSAEQPH